ncbi:hypothetical protein J1907_17735 [Lysinibacillus sphaericus]|uniref:hypothetical protein n=1 Tax=Lysinibacillus sphaericus TaxID=1421 RepID=UPI00055C78F9|nr:hypothetical protein [Lysinibacillus sphaericus]QTB21567.1 hypothetical protein J1907_17735 [Lysinibacillus sphaericus]
MRGRVEMINLSKGFIAVRTENDEFSVVEILDSYCPELGAILIGPLEELGGETLKCIDDSTEFDVYIQDIHSNYSNAKSMLSAY